MENGLELHTDQKNNSEETSQAPFDTQNSSRKSRDSSLFSEEDLKDKEETDAADEHDEESQVDYSLLSKEELVAAVKALIPVANFNTIEATLREVRPLMEEIQHKERDAALEKFKAGGGEVDDFDFTGDKLDNEFDATVRLLRDRKNKYYAEIEQKKNENLIRKNNILEKLRTLADGEDTTNGFNIFKDLQKEWKSIGPVPNAHARTVWANYSALIDLYYDQCSIYFELKELDRRKNLEYKLELCERAEKLVTLDSIKTAVKELNELHHEFRHTGPIPREDKDIVWARFKAASDAVYAKRDEYMAALHETFKKNLEDKKKLIEEVNVFASFTSDRIKEWNQKTKDILALQKKWDAIGGVARAQSREINKQFWSAFKSFFNSKNAFFKKLDAEREQNLEKKKQLVAQANLLKENTDWDKTSEELKKLQDEWKQVGPVPDKQREKIYAEFKAACDYFFEKRREQFSKQDGEQEGNLVQKKAICDALERHAADKTGTPEVLYELIDKFNNLGFVPRKAIKSIKTRFDKAVDAVVTSMPEIGEEEKQRVEMEIQLRSLKNDPHGDRKIQHREHAIRKQINKAESDIAILQNNLEFFGRSKNAEKFKSEFTEKLEVANGELKALKKQLKLLKTVS